MAASMVLSITILHPILAHRFHTPVKTALLFLTAQCAMCAACSGEYKRKQENPMARFTIMHIFEVPAKNQYEATDELMLAQKNHFDKVFLKKVLVKDAEPKLPRDKVNV